MEEPQNQPQTLQDSVIESQAVHIAGLKHRLVLAVKRIQELEQAFKYTMASAKEEVEAGK